MEYTRDALISVVNFFSRNDFQPEDSVTRIALKAIVDATGSLDILHILSNLIVYKEENDPKSKNVTPVSQDLEALLRREAIHGFYYMSEQLWKLSKKTDTKMLLNIFSKIPNLLQNLCATLPSLESRYEIETMKPGMIEEGVWVFFIIVQILQNLEDGTSAFLNTNILESVITLSKESNYTLYALQIFEIVAQDENGLQSISNSTYLTLFLDLLMSSTNQFLQPRPAVTNKDGKDKPVKSEPPKGGKKNAAKEDIPPVIEIKMYNTTDPDRLAISYMKLIVRIFTALTQRAKESVLPHHSEKLVELLNAILLEERIWEISRSPAVETLDVPLHDLIQSIVVLYGCLGLSSHDASVAACKAGAVKGLLSLQDVAKCVFGIHSAASVLANDKSKEKEKKRRSSEVVEVADLLSPEAEALALANAKELRRVAEKSVLHICTQRTHEIIRHIRWKSCSSYLTVTDMFLTSSTVTPAAPSNVPTSVRGSAATAAVDTPVVHHISVAQIMDLITNIDADVSNRGVRLLAATLQGVEDVASFAKSALLDNPNIVIKLAGAVERCGAEVIAFADSFWKSPRDDYEIKGRADNSAALTTPVSAEIFCLALICIEPLLHLSADNVNAFATESVLSILGGVLYRGGPVGCVSENRSTSMQELIVDLHDPRCQGWNSKDPYRGETSKVIMRSLVIDVLTIVVKADKLYRKYEGDVVTAPGTAPAESSSPCSETAMLACRLCGDPAIGILLTQSRYSQAGCSLIAIPASTFVLLKEVLDSSLFFLSAVASCGARGLAAVYESIFHPILLSSKDGSESANKLERFGSLSSLKEYLRHVDDELVDNAAAVLQSPSAERTEDNRLLLPGGKNNLSAPFIWKPPLHFDAIFPIGDHAVKTTFAAILDHPELWPFIVVSGGVLGILARPTADIYSAKLTLDLTIGFSKTHQFQDANQPPLCDIFSTVLLSLGGGVVLTSSLGRFGMLKNYEGGIEYLSYLFGRGSCREHFWSQYMLSKPVDAAAKANKNGKVDKANASKDNKAKDKVNKGGKRRPSFVAEDIVYPFEPDDSHPDPSHGPEAGLWKALLCVPFDDLNSSSIGLLPLTCCLQTGLTETALQLIDIGVDVDKLDGSGLTPLMYCLALGKQDVLRALLRVGANLDALDAYGNPTVKYAFYTLPNYVTDQSSVTYSEGGDYPVVTATGSTELLEHLLEAKVDLMVADPLGYYPLHFALGMDTVDVIISGRRIHSLNGSYADDSIDARDATLELVDRLVAAGSSVHMCNKNGLAPIHIAAAKGHLKLVNYLLEKGPSLLPNAIGTHGFTPLHFAMATCCHDVFEVTNLLVSRGIGRASTHVKFNDLRTGKSNIEKYYLEIETVISSILEEAINPASISGLRMSQLDIIDTKTEHGLNTILLCLAGYYISDIPSAEFITGNDNSSLRLKMVRHLIQMMQPDLQSTLAHTDLLGLSMLHAISLLDETAQGYQATLELILPYCKDVNALCSHTVDKLNLPVPWTPLHAAIAKNNVNLFKTLVQYGGDIAAHPYIHFTACYPNVDPRIANFVVQEAALNSNFNSLLNGESDPCERKMEAVSRPLHIGVRYNNLPIIRALMSCSKVNPNAQDSVSGTTALLEACVKSGSIALLEAFAVDRDRIDLLVKDQRGRTCIDVVIEDQNAEALDFLISMRRNDVVEHVLNSSNADRTSILRKLEQENMALAEKCGVHVYQPANAVLSPSKRDNDLSFQSDVEPVNGDDLVAGADGSFVCVDGLDRPDEVEINTAAGSDKERLEKSDRIIFLLMSAVNETNIVASDVHAHDCFARGKLYGTL